MGRFLDFMFNLFNQIFNLMNEIKFTLNGYDIYWGWLILGVSIMSMFVSVFWKGPQK